MEASQVAQAPRRLPMRVWLALRKDAAKRWLCARLFRAAMAMVDDSSLVSHARRELKAAGYDPNEQEDGPNKWIQQNILDLLRVMAMQEHSGFSGSYLVSAFSKLARFEPLVPLTGADDEWMDHGDGVFQNLRCSRVFKQADRFNGQAYDLDGRVFCEPNGACYTNWDSMVPITFPYTPTIQYVDVPFSEEQKPPARGAKA